MSKENKHALSGAEGLIPEMRFPEFANEAEWKLERLGNLANTTIGEFVIKTKQHPDSLYPHLSKCEIKWFYPRRYGRSHQLFRYRRQKTRHR